MSFKNIFLALKLFDFQNFFDRIFLTNYSNLKKLNQYVFLIRWEVWTMKYSFASRSQSDFVTFKLLLIYMEFAFHSKKEVEWVQEEIVSQTLKNQIWAWIKPKSFPKKD